MKYDFNINTRNIPCHLDIERDIKLQKNGIFTFTVRTNQGIIMDYVNYTNASADDYHSIIVATEPECKVSLDSGTDNPKDAVRGSDSEHQPEGWGSFTEESKSGNS